MATQVQYRRGSAAQNNSFVGALAEITVDTTNGTLRVHDGIAAGGSNIATVAYVDNSISSLSANSITDGTSSVAIIAPNGNIRANVGGSTVQLLSSDGANVTGYVTATGNITGSFILGNGSQLTGIDATSIQSGTSNVRVISSGGNVSVGIDGTSDVAVFSSTGADITGILSVTGNVTGGNLSGTNIVGTLTTAAQTNITSVGTLSALTVTGNITGGNLSGTNIVGTLTTAAQTNITSVGTLSALTVTGNVTGGNLITAGLVSLSSITKTGSNGAGNIGQSNNTFDTVFAKATSAQYADVAERYLADNNYAPGTVLEIGGAAEVQATQTSYSTRLVGVVSTAPALIMNSNVQGDHAVTVALLGRAPCKVTGIVQRGDLLVSSDQPGVAMALAAGQYQPGSVIGKALSSSTGVGESVIEVLVGRL